MQHFGRVVGITALALATGALSACYAPPPPPPAPVAAVTPAQPLPPPPAPVAAAPITLTPYSAGPQYGSTAPPVELPSSAGASVLIAPYAPPAPRAEAPPPAPSPMAIWQPGHWSWTGSQFAWTPGHYVMRPSATANWVPGHWQQGPAGWTWTEGYWS